MVGLVPKSAHSLFYMAKKRLSRRFFIFYSLCLNNESAEYGQYVKNLINIGESINKVLCFVRSCVILILDE